MSPQPQIEAVDDHLCLPHGVGCPFCRPVLFRPSCVVERVNARHQTPPYSLSASDCPADSTNVSDQSCTPDGFDLDHATRHVGTAPHDDIELALFGRSGLGPGRGRALDRTSSMLCSSVTHATPSTERIAFATLTVVTGSGGAHKPDQAWYVVCALRRPRRSAFATAVESIAIVRPAFCRDEHPAELPPVGPTVNPPTDR